MKKITGILLTVAMLIVLPLAAHETAYAAFQVYSVIMLPYDRELGTADATLLTAEPGEMVTLIATAHDNAVFYYWHMYSGAGSVDIDNIYSPVASFVMPDGNVQVRPIFIRTSSDSNTQTAAAIANNHSSWAGPELQRAAALNLIPDSLKDEGIDYTMPVTRAEFAGIVVNTYEKLANIEVQPISNNPFVDTWESDALKAYNAGLMIGVSSSEFAPYSMPSREQTATALTRAFKKFNIPGWSIANDADYPLIYTDPEPFADDADISDWARDSVYFMAANGIIQGVGDNRFAPRTATSAEEAVKFAVTTREEAIVLALRMIENLR